MLESCKQIGWKIFVKRLKIGRTSFLHFIFLFSAILLVVVHCAILSTTVWSKLSMPEGEHDSHIVHLSTCLTNHKLFVGHLYDVRD